MTKGVTVVTRSGLIKLEEIYKKTIFEDEPVSEDVKQRELMEILVDEKNAEILRLYEQLKAKDRQLSEKDEQMRIKDRQIAEKDKTTWSAATIDSSSHEGSRKS